MEVLAIEKILKAIGVKGGIAIVLGLLLIGSHFQALHYKHAAATCEKARFDDRTATELASAQSQVNNLNHVVAVERRNAEIATEKQHVIENQLAANRSAAAVYARLHSSKVHSSGPGEGRLSSTADTAGGADSTVAEAVVPVADLDACADDYTIAQGWQDWWKQISESENAGTAPE